MELVQTEFALVLAAHWLLPVVVIIVPVVRLAANQPEGIGVVHQRLLVSAAIPPLGNF